jgi:hypothetical protein
MAYSEPWRTDSAGVFVVETDEFRLIIRPLDDIGGSMRFLLVRWGRNSVPDTLIATGVTHTKQAAMAAAERTADRCTRPGHVRTTPPAYFTEPVGRRLPDRWLPKKRVRPKKT